MNGVVASTGKEKADLLSNFFSSQCTVPSQIGTADEAPGAPYPLLATSSEFHILLVTEDVVLRHLRKLPACKTTADPILTNTMLRECVPFIHTSLAYLFNLSISTNIFPETWKQAAVVPIFKNRGSKKNPSNYRPVPLLPAVAKVLDAIVSNRLLSYLTRNKLISIINSAFCHRNLRLCSLFI